MPRLFAAPPDHAGGGITPVELSGVPGAIDEGAVRLKYGRLTRLLIRQNISVTTMESCTSGQIASLITDTEGASAVFRGAYVTYCNAAKIALGVPAEVIEASFSPSQPTGVSSRFTARCPRSRPGWPISCTWRT